MFSGVCSTVWAKKINVAGWVERNFFLGLFLKSAQGLSWRKLVEVSALCFLRIDSAQRMDVYCHWYPDTPGGVFPVALPQTENASCLKKKVSDRLKKKTWKIFGTFWALQRRRSTGVERRWSLTDLSQGNFQKSKVLPRFELGWLDSESRVLTITPYNHVMRTGFPKLILLMTGCN